MRKHPMTTKTIAVIVSALFAGWVAGAASSFWSVSY